MFEIPAPPASSTNEAPPPTASGDGSMSRQTTFVVSATSALEKPARGRRALRATGRSSPPPHGRARPPSRTRAPPSSARRPGPRTAAPAPRGSAPPPQARCRYRCRKSPRPNRLQQARPLDPTSHRKRTAARWVPTPPSTDMRGYRPHAARAAGGQRSPARSLPGQPRECPSLATRWHLRNTATNPIPRRWRNARGARDVQRTPRKVGPARRPLWEAHAPRAREETPGVARARPEQRIETGVGPADVRAYPRPGTPPVTGSGCARHAAPGPPPQRLAQPARPSLARLAPAIVSRSGTYAAGLRRPQTK